MRGDDGDGVRHAASALRAARLQWLLDPAGVDGWRLNADGTADSWRERPGSLIVFAKDPDESWRLITSYVADDPHRVDYMEL